MLSNNSIYRQALIDRMEGDITQSRVSVNSINTSYLSSGEGLPVILLHGGGAGAVTWYPTIGAIAKEFHVIAPDIIGYGESDKPDGAYDRPFFSAWLHELLLELGIKRAHIVGLSQGGAIALQFSIDYPDMVDKLVLVDSGGLGAKPTFWPMLAMIWMNCLPSSLANLFNSKYLLSNPRKRDPNHGHYSVEVIKKLGGKNAFSQGRGAAVSEINKESLRQIKNSTLILWGDEDKLFSIKHGEEAAKIIPNAKFCKIQGAGHLPLMDQSSVFNRLLCDFLK